MTHSGRTWSSPTDDPTVPVPVGEPAFYERTLVLPVLEPAFDERTLPLPVLPPVAPPAAASAAPRRSMRTAYALWLFTGALGVHQFYLNRDGWGLVYLVLLVLGPPTLLASLVPLALLLMVDLVAIPHRTRRANRRLAGGR